VSIVMNNRGFPHWRAQASVAIATRFSPSLHLHLSPSLNASRVTTSSSCELKDRCIGTPRHGRGNFFNLSS
jgi:hypothetical protein